MNILIVNDDGVQAPGILALHEVLQDLGKVVVVAPAEERSTTGHSLSLAHPLRLMEMGRDRYAVNGFPADCTLMGFGAVFGKRPDLVVSGINRGGNLGQDVFYSGTVAGAREASFHNVPAMAVSLVTEFSDKVAAYEDYASVAKIVRELILKGLHRQLPPLHLLNINVPFVERERLKGIKMTTVGFRNYSDKIEKMIDPRRREYYWIVGKYEGFAPIDNSDCKAIHEHMISVSPLAPFDQQKELPLELYKLVEELNGNFKN